MALNTVAHICFFSDEKAQRFQPLTLTRPLDDLRVGIYTIREKWMRSVNAKTFSRVQPDYLNEVFVRGKIEQSTPVLWINSRFLPSEKLLNAVDSLNEGERLVFREDTVAAKVNVNLSGELFNQNIFSDEGLDPVEITELIHLEYLWDLLSLNPYEIPKDIPLTGLKSIIEEDRKYDASLYQPNNIFIGKDVKIEPGVIILAQEGPVVLLDGAHIESGSILKGPVVIGEEATVKMGARIYRGSTIGPVCKAGGEISNCIFHSYSNKAHDGFAGNSIFGQWVNLGADTNTSNLKNNYSNVRVADWSSRTEKETEAQFLGTIMADHSKTSINTMLNTGTVCGVSSNIFMSGFPPKYIPSFSWVATEEYAEYKFQKAIEAMAAMMKRREVELTEGYKNMMHSIFLNR